MVQAYREGDEGTRINSNWIGDDEGSDGKSHKSQKLSKYDAMVSHGYNKG
jgi:hypothetical protein